MALWSAQDLITFFTVLTGIAALILQYRKDNRSNLKDDYDRVKTERDALRLEQRENEAQIDRAEETTEDLSTRLAQREQRIAELEAECDRLRKLSATSQPSESKGAGDAQAQAG